MIYYFFFLFLINYSEFRKNRLSITNESTDITPIIFDDYKLGYDLRNEKNFNNTENTEVMNRIYDSLYKKEILDILENQHISIYNKLHWEDLSIGFQCKVLRNPNLYNVNFWHHFTNTYVTSINVRSVTNCASCESLNHFFDNQIHQNPN